MLALFDRKQVKRQKLISAEIRHLKIHPMIPMNQIPTLHMLIVPPTNAGATWCIEPYFEHYNRIIIKHFSLLFQKPYLQIEIQDSWVDRKKRTLSKVCSPEAKEEDVCCMASLKVDFAVDYGWNFIIWPPVFEPNYCMGDCSLGKMMPSNPHAHVLQQSGISPCCSPTKMGTLELIYMDEKDNVVQGTLPKMMVEKCGCA